jgi:hypothetical protein
LVQEGAVTLLRVEVREAAGSSGAVANVHPGRGGFGGASFGPPDQVFGTRNTPGL